MHSIALLFLSILALFAAAGARADEIEITQVRLEAGEEGLALHADFAFEFNARLADAVRGGVPLYFVVDFELTRPRWWWFDDKSATKRNQLKLSYHPLSRQFRLASGVIQQSFGSLDEALQVLRRVRNWIVVERSAPLQDGVYEAAVRMRLDLTLLPKPFQVSALTSRDWHLESGWKRFTYRNPAQAAPAEPADATRKDMRREDTRREDAEK
jgi:hypothetical protein